MDTLPLVSVIIPLYNQEKYLNVCMRSVCDQTYKHLEIIVVNDGSTDSSPQMAHDWASKDSRVIVIDKQNEGTAFARRDGYLQATGEFIAFVDSDDLLAPGSIDKMVQCAIKNDVDLVMGLYDNWLGRLSTHTKVDKSAGFPYGQVISQPELFDKYYVNFFQSGRLFPVNVWGKLYRKSVIDKAHDQTVLFSPEVPFMGEDLHLNVKIFPFLRSAYRIDESVYRYRHGGGTAGFNKKFPQIFRLSDIRLDLLDKYEYSKGYEPLFAEYVAFLFHHAAQMIYFKIAEKEEVVDFFKRETETRRLVPRLEAYYNENGTDNKGVLLLLSKDYKAMYDFAENLGKQTFGSLKYKMINALVKLLS